MENNNVQSKNVTRLILVLVVVFLLLIIAGVAYAYFMARLSSSGATEEASVKTGTVGDVIFNNGATLTLKNAFPGDTDTKEFTIKADDNSTVSLDYTVYLNVIENTFILNNLKYKVTANTDGQDKEGKVTPTSNDYVVIDPGSYIKGKKIAIGTGTLGKEGTTDTWIIELTLADSGVQQNDDQEKQFSAKITVEPGKN